MKKKPLIILSILFSLFVFEKTFAKAFFIGQIISKEIQINKSFKIKLPEGEWEVVRMSSDGSYGITQRIIGIIRVENNEVMELIEIYEGLLAGIYQSAVNEAIYEIVFKNKYDGAFFYRGNGNVKRLNPGESAVYGWQHYERPLPKK